MGWSRVYSRDNPTSTNKVRVCVPGEIAAGLEVGDILLVADGLTRHVKARNPNAAIALLRMTAQVTWRIANDRYEERENAFCFIIELSYDEYEALCRVKDYIIGLLDAQKTRYEEILNAKKARSEAAVRRRLDAIVFLREFVKSACDYHAQRRRKARR